MPRGKANTPVTPLGPVEKVTAFRTPDGQVFESKRLAENHLDEQVLDNILLEFDARFSGTKELRLVLADELREQGWRLINVLSSLARRGVPPFGNGECQQDVTTHGNEHTEQKSSTE